MVDSTRHPRSIGLLRFTGNVALCKGVSDGFQLFVLSTY
jgi:hypothetical protein